jgi:HEAT repeat protein
MFGEPTVAELIEGLKGGPPGVRANCALTLGHRDMAGEEAKAAVAVLLEAVKDEDVLVRRNALWAFFNVGPQAVPALLEALKDDFWVVRNDAAGTLGQIGRQAVEAVPALLEALKDPDYYVRESSASALDRIDPAAKDNQGR